MRAEDCAIPMTSPSAVQTLDRLLTPDEVAALARVKLRTVGVWRRTGVLPAVPLPGGRVWRYRLMDVAAALGLKPSDLLALAAATAPRGDR